MRTTLSVAAAALLLAGCAGSSDVEPIGQPTATTTVTTTATATVTETQEAATEPAATMTVTETVTAPPELEDIEAEGEELPEELQQLALDMAWEQMSSSDQANLCLGWSLDKEMMLEGYTEGLDPSAPSEDMIRAFFDRKCE